MEGKNSLKMLINKLWKTVKISIDIAFQDIFLPPSVKYDLTGLITLRGAETVLHIPLWIQLKYCG
jgi:hypothetical protein